MIKSVYVGALASTIAVCQSDAYLSHVTNFLHLSKANVEGPKPRVFKLMIVGGDHNRGRDALEAGRPW